MILKKYLGKAFLLIMLSSVFISGSVLYAMASIPSGCETPGDCDQLTPSLLELSIQNIIRFTDSDGSNFVGVQSPATVSSDVTFTLPDSDGTSGQTLKTDGSGNLSFNQVSKRVGEFVFAKTDATKTEARGYLAVSPGIISDGATDYPVWAAMYPEFVSGNDILFPADVAGIFMRNIGGGSGAEGSFQNDSTARPNANFTTNTDTHNHSLSGSYTRSVRVTGNDTSNGQDSTNGEIDVVNSGIPLITDDSHNHSITGGGDPETRPNNYAYQLYTIIDTY